MAIYAEVQGMGRLEFPDGTDPEVIKRTVRRIVESRPKSETYDPTEGMAGWQKVAAGLGKSVVDAGRGIRQLVAPVNPFDTVADATAAVDEAKRLDQPLMNTGAGFTGNLIGNVGMAVAPGGAVMRGGQLLAKAAPLAKYGNAVSNVGKAYLMPQTIPGAALAGGLQGFVQPVASDESRIGNTALGTVGGAALPVAATATKLGASVLAPLVSKKAQDRVVGRTIERFAADPSSLGRMSGELVPGSVPTLAEATQDIGLSQLQRTLRNIPDANNAITERMLKNQEARNRALTGIAGDEGQREFFDASRKTAAEGLYQQAFEQSPTLTPWIKGQITQLRSRPAFNEAIKNAETLALNDGVKLTKDNVVQIMHYTKLALDDMIAGAKGNEQRALLGTKNKVVELLESKDFAPAYKEARITFAEMSRPINQMDVGKELRNRLNSAISDFGGQVRVRPEAYAQAVRNLDQTAATATGFKGAKADKIFDPQQLQAVYGVANDLGRSVNAQSLGLQAGQSPTAQNLVGHDLLRQVLGPLGLPKSWSEGAAATTLLKPLSWVYGPLGTEANILKRLGEVAANSNEAKLLLAELTRRRNAIAPYVDRATQLSAVPVAAGLLNFQQ